MYISREAAMDLELNTPHPLNQCMYPQRASLAFDLVNLPRPVLNRILFLTTNKWGEGLPYTPLSFTNDESELESSIFDLQSADLSKFPRRFDSLFLDRMNTIISNSISICHCPFQHGSVPK